MGGTIAEQREVLQWELERLEALLALNANWQALRLLEAREPPEESSRGAEFSAERAKLEAALERNPVFRQRKLIVETMVSIDALSEQSSPPDGTPPPVEDTGAARAEASLSCAPAPEDAAAGVQGGEAPSADQKQAAGRRPAKSRTAPLSLRSRLRQVQRHTEFDGAGYAAYHGEIGEATVEIVRRNPGRD
jgi:hypothetical protein